MVFLNGYIKLITIWVFVGAWNIDETLCRHRVMTKVPKVKLKLLYCVDLKKNIYVNIC